jgi:hypothetical protein
MPRTGDLSHGLSYIQQYSSWLIYAGCGVLCYRAKVSFLQPHCCITLEVMDLSSRLWIHRVLLLQALLENSSASAFPLLLIVCIAALAVVAKMQRGGKPIEVSYSICHVIALRIRCTVCCITDDVITYSTPCRLS